MRSDTIPIRDRLLAALRDADGPLSTTEVCHAAGSYLRFERHHQMNHDAAANPRWGVITCNGRLDLVKRPLTFSQRGWRELAALEKQGHVVKERAEGSINVYWTLVRDASTQDPSPMLESLWDAPAHDAAEPGETDA